MTGVGGREAFVSRAVTLEALPELLTLAREALIADFDPDDQESVELKTLLDACVVGSHRLRLREQLRLLEACEGR